MTKETGLLGIGDHIRLALAEIHPEVARFTYPLFAVDTRDRPDLYATSVLIECDGIPVLLTAAHAIYEISKSGSAVHIGAKHITQLSPQFVLSSEDGSDPLDLAAIEFPVDLMKSEEMKALPLARTMLGKTFSSVHMRCIHGYPCTKNRTNHRVNEASKTFSKFGFTYAGSSTELQVDYPSYNKETIKHVALQYQRDGKNEKGEKATPPKPKGMSGGGLWLIPDSFNPKALYLEGIAIEFHKGKSLVFATRIEHAIAFIRRNVLRQA
ncbi:MAG: hypothetical protein Q7T21_10620 [Gallionella sp.]|nr:hypothetical protein [Gallionella sp.]